MDEVLDIETLYTRHLKAVYTYVSHRVSSPAEAEDITADIFAAAIAAWSKFRGDCSPYAWLLGIARRRIAETSRRRRQRPELLDADLTDTERETLGLLTAEDLGPLPEEVVLHAEAQGVMRRLLDGLPESQREVLLLQAVDRLPIREIARVTGRSVPATNSLLERARATIFRRGHAYFVG